MVFLEYLNGKMESSQQPQSERLLIRERYGSTLMDLSNLILQKVQFKFNASQLEEVDDEKLDDDSETEWDKLICEVYEVIEKLLEIMPVEIFHKQKQLLDSSFEMLIKLSNHINPDRNGWNRLSLTDENESNTIHFTLRDLSTSLRGIGAVSSLFVGEDRFKEFFQEGLMVVERITQVAVFGTYYKTYNIKMLNERTLSKDFLEVQAQALASIKAYSHWLAQFNVLTTQNKGQKERFTSSLLSIMEATIPMLMIKEIPMKVQMAAAHLLVSIATTVRPSFFLALGSVQKLYEAVANGQLSHLPLQVEVELCRALSNSLVLPWPGLSQDLQEWEMRSSNHKHLVNAICKDFNSDSLLRAFSHNEQERRKPSILRVCAIISALIEVVSGEATPSKKVMFQSTDECLQTAVAAFPVYISHPDITEAILNLLLIGMHGLKVRMGLGFVQEIIQRLLEILTREQLMKIVGENNHFGCKVVEKFLKILELVVQEPNTSFKKLTSSVITFGLEHILPVLNKSMSADLKGELFQLFHQLLIHNWRYFYKVNVLSKMSEPYTLENEHQFVSIIKEFGRALMENDISLFKKSLTILEDLNEKYKLYRKAIFKENMMPNFLQVLLQAQINKSHQLLEEEIMTTVYNMVSVDFGFFFSTFIPQYLLQAEGLSDQQKAELLQNLKVDQDFPSFSTNIQRFASDLRYYRIINRSLAPGTIEL